jgi:hypothetical protein
MLIWKLNKRRCQLIIIKVTIRNQPDSILNRGYFKGEIIMETIAFNDFMKEIIRKKNTTHPKVEIRNQFRI